MNDGGIAHIIYPFQLEIVGTYLPHTWTATGLFDNVIGSNICGIFYSSRDFLIGRQLLTVKHLS